MNRACGTNGWPVELMPFAMPGACPVSGVLTRVFGLRPSFDEAV